MGDSWRRGSLPGPRTAGRERRAPGAMRGDLAKSSGQVTNAWDQIDYRIGKVTPDDWVAIVAHSYPTRCIAAEACVAQDTE